MQERVQILSDMGSSGGSIDINVQELGGESFTMTNS
jgi:hypothetical protein